MGNFFYNLGRQLGRGAIPAIRQSKLIWDGLTGSEEDVLRAEQRLGSALAIELRAATERSTDPGHEKLANELCQRMASRLKNSQRTFRCEVTHADIPNAMALPGGFIFLSDSLVKFCEGEPDELAFVIGHEMAHVVRGHARERVVNQAAVRAASVVTARAGPLGAWLQHNGLNILTSAHSRDCELEADELGLRLATAAGQEAGGAIALLQRIDRLGQDAGMLGPYFSSHPPASERIARLTPLWRALAGQQTEH
jgi:beta-barrel assembly-enhancing protease